VTGLALEMREGGVVLKVRAAPGAPRDRIAGVLGGALKVAVAAPPEKGKANRRIAELLTEVLALQAGSVRLLSGGGAKDKRWLLLGISAAELRARVDAHLTSNRRR
jgi:uncharacterized protein (TIGR00251 family)